MAVISAATARDYIPTLSGDASDSLIDTLISRFDALAAAHMGFPEQSSGALSIEVGTYNEYFDGAIDGKNGRELMLTVRPAVSITSLFDDPDQHYDDTTDQIASDNFILYGVEGRLVLRNDKEDSAFSDAPRAIRVIYTAGYSGATMPKAIEHAACLQVAHWFQGRGHIGKTNVSSAGQTAALMSLSLLPEVKEALSPYRLPTSWIG
ncbi:MAG: hypothetical protein Unbinned4118contig1001_22 [Prokaryotic dsDNA virus sp.]|jgi:hypothetical protein|nr:MAG: hypothetical protein Unbinned4118contig1001_22 [Prokaryotic dsDNA virus sp.]|tara:strand:+ start:1927 stop:2547 length:621 start_codon:yes stop_codon:yes gene_type:complete